MIQRYNRLVSQISKRFEDLAAVILFLVMTLVITNVALRAFFGTSLKGAVELVSFLTAIAISLSLAYCAVKEGHVFISLFVERFSLRTQRIIDTIIGSVSVVFLLTVAWHIAQYAHTMQLRGEVSMTMGIPQSPFIYLVAAGIGMLALVVLGSVLQLSVKRGDR